jgi:hypothetical protein
VKEISRLDPKKNHACELRETVYKIKGNMNGVFPPRAFSCSLTLLKKKCSLQAFTQTPHTSQRPSNQVAKTQLSASHEGGELMQVPCTSVAPPPARNQTPRPRGGEAMREGHGGRPCSQGPRKKKRLRKREIRVTTIRVRV